MPIFTSPVLAWLLGGLGAAVVVKVLKKEWQRVNGDLYARAPLREAPVRERIPVLRRDPTSGIYRPE